MPAGWFHARSLRCVRGAGCKRKQQHRGVVLKDGGERWTHRCAVWKRMRFWSCPAGPRSAHSSASFHWPRPYRQTAFHSHAAGSGSGSSFRCSCTQREKVSQNGPKLCPERCFLFSVYLDLCHALLVITEVRMGVCHPESCDGIRQIHCKPYRRNQSGVCRGRSTSSESDPLRMYPE